MPKRKKVQMSSPITDLPAGKEPKKVGDLIKRLPSGFPVSHILVNGVKEEVTRFINEKDGVAYFLVNNQLIAYETKDINGILFGTGKPRE
ncbi:hypothetical protein AB1K84_02705 [Mesobacillus foraminis]|uniref:hypothetical protein n=1 Tax=Mesobacillus foraminis TaxID=279826 RepID=UPI0039A0D4A9